MDETGVTINAGNISEIFANLKSKIKLQENKDMYLVIASTRWTRSTRYRGKGRPRKSDYDYNELCMEDFDVILPTTLIMEK